MVDITATLVKALREKSGVGMMDCKKALQETDGDMEFDGHRLATRQRAFQGAAKKGGPRIAAEGVVAIATRVDGRGRDGGGHRTQRRDRLRGPATRASRTAVARNIATTSLDVEGDIEACAPRRSKGRPSLTR